MSMTKEDFEEIKKIVKDGQDGTIKAVHEMFVSVGINIDDPIKVQSQMNFLAKATKMADSIVAKSVLAIFTAIGLLALGICSISKIKGP